MGGMVVNLNEVSRAQLKKIIDATENAQHKINKKNKRNKRK